MPGRVSSWQSGCYNEFLVAPFKQDLHLASIGYEEIPKEMFIG